MSMQNHSQLVYVPENSGIAGVILGTLFGLTMVLSGLCFFVFVSADAFSDFPNWTRQLCGASFILIGSGVFYAMLNGTETVLEIVPTERKLIVRKTARLTGSSERKIFFNDILEVELSNKVEALAVHPRDFTNYVLNVSILFKDPANGKQKREYVYIGPAEKAENCEAAIRNAMNSTTQKYHIFGSSR